MQDNGLTITDEEILTRFAKVVAHSLRIDPEKVTMDGHFDELGVDSLDLVVMTMDLEDEFDISIPDKSIIAMAEEVFGRDVILRDGKLTEVGRTFLLRRVPDLTPDQLAGDVTLADLRHVLMSVRAWVRMIRGLLEQTPQACAACGAPLAKGGKGALGVRKCTGCGQDNSIPLGEDLNRRWIQDYYENEFLPSQPARVSAVINPPGDQPETA